MMRMGMIDDMEYDDDDDAYNDDNDGNVDDDDDAKYPTALEKAISTELIHLPSTSKRERERERKRER
jgi:hypothetical protein